MSTGKIVGGTKSKKFPPNAHFAVHPPYRGYVCNQQLFSVNGSLIMTTIWFEGKYYKNTVYGWAITLTSASLVERLHFQLSVCQPSHKVLGLWLVCHRHPTVWWGKNVPPEDGWSSAPWLFMLDVRGLGISWLWRIQPVKKPLRGVSFFFLGT